MSTTGRSGPTPEAKETSGTGGQRHPSLATRTVAGALGLGLLSGAAWGLAGPQTGTSEVQLESVSSAGSSPFMSPVGEDQSGVTPPPGSAGEISGGTDGLFADNGGGPSCDVQSLVSNLQVDESRAQAWAEVLGTRSEEIPQFVENLKPVLLRSDTSVTSHGYANGQYTAYPAVLQAGTAVFINDRGEPTVKCFNGNPLTKGEFNPQSRYTGSAWEHFRAGAVTSIQPNPTMIQNPKLTDIDGSSGSGGQTGTKPKPDPALEAAAAAAKKKAEEARANADKAAKIASESRARADDKKVEARIFETEAKNLEAIAKAKFADLQQAAMNLTAAKNKAAALLAAWKADPLNFGKLAAARQAARQVTAAQKVFQAKGADASEATKKANDARAEADSKARQVEMAEAKARNDENVAKITEDSAKKAEQEAEKAKEAADKAAGRKTTDDKKAGDKDADEKDAPAVPEQKLRQDQTTEQNGSDEGREQVDEQSGQGSTDSGQQSSGTSGQSQGSSGQSQSAE